MSLSIADTKREHNYVLPAYPLATGQPTISIPGYPAENNQPMGETDFHARQIITLSHQLRTFLEVDEHVYVGTDNFIYYQQGNPSKKVAPDIYVVCGVDAIPARRSFYIWAEGVAPTVVFEFLSDGTANIDRRAKRALYLKTIGIKEYFIHQPQGDRPSETRGWRKTEDRKILEIPHQSPPWEGASDEPIALFSEALNLWFIPEDQPDKVRLLRPYFSDGIPLPTHSEAVRERDQARQERNHFQIRMKTLESQNESLKVELERLRTLLDHREDS